jgi:hypothetical protein
MSSWRLARGVGAVATVRICFSAFAHPHGPRGIGSRLAKDPLKSLAQRIKSLESLDDSQTPPSGPAAVGLNAPVYANPEEASLGRNGFDRLKPEELAEDKAAGQHILATAGENAATAMMRKWLV